MKFDIIGKRKWAFLISGALIVISIIALLTAGLKPGIEFSSGSMLTLSFDSDIEYDDFKAAVAEIGYTDAIIQHTGTGNYLIRTQEIDDQEKEAIIATLEEEFGTVSEASFSSVSPQVASETLRNALIAVLIAAVGILLYITWAFRRMPKPLHYGVCAVATLAHDAVVALGIFSILGAIMSWEIDLVFITGILAVIGYSVNNTVVIFDRIRENTLKNSGQPFWITVNNSLVETLSRSMNTSITTFVAVLALAIFVGSTILNFSVVLIIGIVVGTFSSVLVAPGLLVAWDNSSIRRRQKALEA